MMAKHHIVKISPQDFRKLEKISSGLLELLQEEPDMCVCDDGCRSVGLPPIVCEIHDLEGLIHDLRRIRDSND